MRAEQHIYTALYHGGHHGYSTVAKSSGLSAEDIKILERHASTGFGEVNLRARHFMPIYRFFPINSHSCRYVFSKTVSTSGPRGNVYLTHSAVIGSDDLSQQDFDIGGIWSKVPFVDRLTNGHDHDIETLDLSIPSRRPLGFPGDRTARSHAATALVTLIRMLDNGKIPVLVRVNMGSPTEYVSNLYRCIPSKFRNEFSIIINAQASISRYTVCVIGPEHNGTNPRIRGTNEIDRIQLSLQEEGIVDLLAGSGPEEGPAAWRRFLQQAGQSNNHKDILKLFSLWSAKREPEDSQFITRTARAWENLPKHTDQDRIAEVVGKSLLDRCDRDGWQVLETFWHEFAHDTKKSSFMLKVFIKICSDVDSGHALRVFIFTLPNRLSSVEKYLDIHERFLKGVTYNIDGVFKAAAELSLGACRWHRQFKSTDMIAWSSTSSAYLSQLAPTPNAALYYYRHLLRLIRHTKGIDRLLRIQEVIRFSVRDTERAGDELYRGLCELFAESAVFRQSRIALWLERHGWSRRIVRHNTHALVVWDIAILLGVAANESQARLDTFIDTITLIPMTMSERIRLANRIESNNGSPEICSRLQSLTNTEQEQLPDQTEEGPHG